ncbi:hypothetical protein CGRA01v4_11775 [Colletotrichum graminicola]|nr:hypothetical protein CGRA01v4_11775 [Colletotrichum graminicola]
MATRGGGGGGGAEAEAEEYNDAQARRGTSLTSAGRQTVRPDAEGGAESCIVVAADCRGENLTEEARLGGRRCEPGASAARLSSSRISVNARQPYMG